MVCSSFMGPVHVSRNIDEFGFRSDIYIFRMTILKRSQGVGILVQLPGWRNDFREQRRSSRMLFHIWNFWKVHKMARCLSRSLVL